MQRSEYSTVAHRRGQGPSHAALSTETTMTDDEKEKLRGEREAAHKRVDEELRRARDFLDAMTRQLYAVKGSRADFDPRSARIAHGELRRTAEHFVEFLKIVEPDAGL